MSESPIWRNLVQTNQKHMDWLSLRRDSHFKVGQRPDELLSIAQQGRDISANLTQLGIPSPASPHSCRKTGDLWDGLVPSSHRTEALDVEVEGMGSWCSNAN